MLLFPRGCRNPRSVSPLIPFYNLQPISLVRTSLEAYGKFKAVLLVLLKDGKVGKGQTYPNAGRENHEAAKRISKCFTMPRTSLSLGKRDFWQTGACWRSSQAVSESTLFLLMHSQQSGAKLLLCLHLWGHFNKMKFQIIWRFLWQKEKYKVNCFFFFSSSFRSLFSVIILKQTHFTFDCLNLYGSEAILLTSARYCFYCLHT